MQQACCVLCKQNRAENVADLWCLGQSCARCAHVWFGEEQLPDSTDSSDDTRSELEASSTNLHAAIASEHNFASEQRFAKSREMSAVRLYRSNGLPLNSFAQSQLVTAQMAEYNPGKPFELVQIGFEQNC